MPPSPLPAFRVAALLCALVPGVVAWWTGRQLLGRRDDPALPELLLQRRSLLTKVGVVAFVVLLSLAHGATLVAALALFAVALLVGAYPARRAMRGETWGLGAYVWNTLRRVTASAGIFAALALAPQLVLGVPARWAPWVAGAVALLLVAWMIGVVPLWLRAYAATPLAAHPIGAALAPRLAEVAARSRARAPETYRIGAPGERMVGAFAVPTASRPPVVAFGEALLELLTPEELTAVFAHEVAHLEYLTPARVRRGRVVGALLGVGGVALALAVRGAAPASAWLMTYLWPVAVLFALAARASRSKAHEFESDRRAAELCGDPEAMVRALVTLHTALHLPRRWSTDFERAASHPSLANRIRAIRATAAAPATASPAPPAETGGAAESLGGPVVLRSTRRGTYVVLDAARVSVLAGVPDDAPAGGTTEGAAALRERAASVRAESYGQLVELRVAAEPRGARVLVATDRAGASWRVPLDPADVRAAQDALDVVDVRLAPQTAAAGGGASAAATRALAVLVPVTALTAAVVTGHVWLVLLAALLAMVRPGPASLALLGATALGSALTALAWDAASMALVLPDTVTALAVLALTLAGAVSLLLAWKQLRANAAAGHGDAESSPNDRGAKAAVVAPAVVAALLVAGAAALWLATSSTAAALPLVREAAVALAGLAAALAATTAGRPRRRRLALAAGAAALAAALLPLGLRDRSAGGAPARRLALGTAAALPEAARVAFDAPARDLRLSPSATRWAVRLLPPIDSAAAAAGVDPDDEEWEGVPEGEDNEARYVVGAFGDAGASAPRRAIAASDLAFVDDDHVLALATRGPDSLALTLEPAAADGGGASWEARLPPLDGPRLRYAVAADGARTWTVVGRERGTRDVVALSGRVGVAGGVVTRRWSAAAARAGGAAARVVPPDLYVAGGVVPTPDGGALAVRMDNTRPRWWMLMAMVGVPPWRWEAWRLAGDGPPLRVLSAGGLLRCVAPHADGAVASGPSSGAPPAAVCLAQDGGDATVWVVPAAAGGAPRAVGRVAGWYGEPVAGPDGRVALPAPDGRTAVLVDVRAGRATQLALGAVPAPTPAGGVAATPLYARETEWTRGGVAHLASDARSRSELVLYRLR